MCPSRANDRTDWRPPPIHLSSGGGLANLPFEHFVKTFQTRTLPLLSSIALGTALSWASIYAFWFAIWTFHSVPIARACDLVADFILIPATWIFEWLGGDQTTMFTDSTSFAGTNGLILGILFYSIFRAWWTRHEAAHASGPQPSGERRIEAKVI